MEIIHISPTEATLTVKLLKPLVKRNGEVTPAGTTVRVKPISGKSNYAMITPLTENGSPILENVGRISWELLYQMSTLEYPEGLDEDSIAEKLYDDSTVFSILGEEVEPDGTDPYGFPSILMALGYV